MGRVFIIKQLNQPSKTALLKEESMRECLSPNLEQNIPSKCNNLVHMSEVADLPTAFLFQEL